MPLCQNVLWQLISILLYEEGQGRRAPVASVSGSSPWRHSERQRQREREIHSLIKVQEVRAALRAAYAPGSLTSWHFITADERIKAAPSIACCPQRHTERHRLCAGNSSRWAVIPCALAQCFLLNVGAYLRNYTASHSRTLRHSYSLQRPEISRNNNNNNNNNNKEKLKEKFGSCTGKTFDRFTTKDSCTWNMTHNTESTAV